MKQSVISFLSLFVIITNCYSQDKYTTLDSLESSFDTISHSVTIPCDWKMVRKIKTNGKPFFINEDSTRLEFTFFTATSMPILDGKKLGLVATIVFYDQKLKEKNYRNTGFEKIEEDKERGFVIFEIKDISSTFYYLISENANNVFSVKIYDKIMPKDSQLEYLRTLNNLNKD